MNMRSLSVLPILCVTGIMVFSRELDLSTLERVRESQLELIRNTSYWFKQIETISKLKCAEQCFVLAQWYSMVCAGVIISTHKNSCFSLFSFLRSISVLNKATTTELLGHGTLYLFRPHVGKCNVPVRGDFPRSTSFNYFISCLTAFLSPLLIYSL